MNNSLVQNSISNTFLTAVLFDAGMNMTHDDVDVCLVNNHLDNVCDLLDQEITQLEVQDAIRALKSNKTAGPDGLSGAFYKYMALCIITCLHNIPINFLRLGHSLVSGANRQDNPLVTKVTQLALTTIDIFLF